MTTAFSSWKEVLHGCNVCVIFGQRGEGKSVLAWKLAEDAHMKGYETIAYLAPKKSRQLLPQWVKHVDELKSLAKCTKTYVIVDEAALKAAARKHQSPENRLWGMLVAISRQNDHVLIFIAQHTRQVDINIVGDADIIIFKRPSLLHVRFSRPELRQDVLEARKAILTKGKHSQKWSVVMDLNEGRQGVLSNGLPSFWSDALSKSFQQSNIEDFSSKSKK